MKKQPLSAMININKPTVPEKRRGGKWGNRMRRKDRERDAAFAWSVFDRAPYGVLSMRDNEGGYGVPISPARVGGRVYFHCALAGKKLECLSRWPEATLTVAEAGEPDYFSVCFSSAIFCGRVTVVEDEAEKREALTAITCKYCPDLAGETDRYLEGHMAATCVCRMDVREITGKERVKE